MILAAWTWSLLYNLGPLVGWTDTSKNVYTCASVYTPDFVSEYKAGASQCGPIRPYDTLTISHSLTNTIFNFILPIVVMSYCYYKIFAEVREHMNR